MGTTVADAFLKMYMFESTCQIQIAAQTGGGKLTLVDPKIIESVGQAIKIQAGGRGTSGQFVWPARVRKLERLDPGYKSSNWTRLGSASPKVKRLALPMRRHLTVLEY